jgi:hypothetical protein
MKTTTQRLRMALAALLSANSAIVHAENVSPAIGSLPGGLNVGSDAATATLSRWEMISDPMTGLENQLPSSGLNPKLNPPEHWVQLVPPAELNPTTEVNPSIGDSRDTIRIVTPIATQPSSPEPGASDLPIERNIRGISLDITAPAGTMPPNPAAKKFEPKEVLSGFDPRPWQDEVYFWDSPVFCHRPLYFEERNLERYGHVRFPAIRPVVSGAHFFASCVSIPYQTVLYPPCQCVLTSQPSSLQLKHPSELGVQDLKAATVQTATVAGLILLVP